MSPCPGVHPSHTVALDLGKNVCGAAVFSGRSLTQVASVRTSLLAVFLHNTVGPSNASRGGASLVVERPVRRRGTRARYKDVDTLTTLAKDIKSAYSFARLVSPEGWKGQVPKLVHQARIIEELDAAETAVVQPWMESDRNWKDICDAVGIGLWFLGRLDGTRRPR